MVFGPVRHGTQSIIYLQKKDLPARLLKRQMTYLLPEEIAAGWKSLFNGQKIIAGNGTIVLSDKNYKNFELEFDWRIEPGTDGGIFYHLPSDISFAQLANTYPEIQLVDEENNDSANANPTHLTGALFNMIGPRFKISKPSSVNHFRLVFNNGHAEHWLNGIKVTEYDNNAGEWKKMWRTKFGVDPVQFETGRVALVVQQGRIHFSNIRIREL
jgi:hypothetical protein